MFEPRGTFHTVTLLTINDNTVHHNRKRRRRRRLPHHNDPQQQQQQQHDTEPDVHERPLYEQHYYEEPEIPIHPALEFEIQTTERKEISFSLPQQNSDSSLLLSSSVSTTTRATIVPSETHQQTPPLGLFGTPQFEDIYNHGNDLEPNIDTPLLLSDNNISNISNSSNSRKLRFNQSKNETTINDFYYWFAIICLVLSGVGIALTLKLQAISMYNYPNFLNIYSNLLYIPLCFAYIVPITSSFSLQPGKSENSNNSNWPSKSLSYQMMIIGMLDAITATFQTFAAVYLPGPLLVLIPQAAIPVSMLYTLCFADTKISGTRKRDHSSILSVPTMGGILVLVGIIIVLVPVWSSQRAPDYYCEATDPYNDCSVCKIATTKIECAAKSTSKANHLNLTGMEHESTQWLFNTSSTDDLQPNSVSAPCQWVPFEESTKEKESLEVIWSILLFLSTIPMAISASYKQRAIHSLSSGDTIPPPETTDSTSSFVTPTPQAWVPSSPVLYISGWIAVFQLLSSLILAIPAGMISSPTIHPWKVPENVLNGLLCYAGYPVVANGCHPDSMCTSYHVALWVNVGVLCHVLYAVSVMIILQVSNNCIPLFLALTATVPLGHFAFTLPLFPLSFQEGLHTIDLIGLVVIVSGLVLYRFTNEAANCSKRKRRIHLISETDDESVLSVDDSVKLLSQQIQSSISSFWSQVANQTSYTLLRETFGPVQNGNV